MDACCQMMYDTFLIARRQHQMRTQYLHNVLVVCRVIDAEVVGATSSDDILDALCTI